MRILKAAPLVSLAVLTLYAMPQPASAVVANAFAPDPSCQANARVWSVEFGNGVMYVGGAFTKVRPFGTAGGDPNEQVRNRVAACSESDGKLLPWDPNVNGTVYAILPLQDKVYIGGSFTSVGGLPRSNFAAVSLDTGAVLPNTPAADKTVRVIEKGLDGKIYVGGHFSIFGGQKHGKIARFDATTGIADAAWSPTVAQKATTAPCPPRCPPKVFTIEFGDYKDPSGAIVDAVYLGGHFGLVNGADREQAAAVSRANGSILRFNPWIYNDTNCPTCTQVETHRVYHMTNYNNKMYMCGGFWVTYSKPNKTNPNAPRGLRQNSFNVLVTDEYKGWKDPAFGAGNDGDTMDCEVENGVFYMGGHFDWAGRICSQNPPPGKYTQKCTSSNSNNRKHVEAVHADSGNVLCWNPGELSPHGPFATSADPDPNVHYVGFGGEHRAFGGVTQQAIAMYHTRLADPNCKAPIP